MKCLRRWKEAWGFFPLLILLTNPTNIMKKDYKNFNQYIIECLHETVSDFGLTHSFNIYIITNRNARQVDGRLWTSLVLSHMKPTHYN
jgi:hypothetical protein